MTRRNFITWYLAGLLTAFSVALVMPILAYIYPPAGNNKKQDIPIKLDKPLGDLGNGEGVKFQAPADQGFVMKDGGGDNAPGKIAFAGYAAKDERGNVNVFATNCSHLGCSINLNSDKKRFECPCHGSIFDIDGKVTHGPAVYPLSHLDWKEGSNPGEIVVGGIELKGIG